MSAGTRPRLLPLPLSAQTMRLSIAVVLTVCIAVLPSGIDSGVWRGVCAQIIPITSFTPFGSFGSGTGQLSNPVAVTVDSTSGAVWVADAGNSRIVQFQPSDMNKTFVAYGSYGSDIGQFNNPRGVAVESRAAVWVADYFNDRVVRFDSNNFLGSFTGYGVQGSGSGQLSNPAGVALDGSGYVWVSDCNNNRIVRFNPADFTKTFTSFGSVGIGNNQFTNPNGLFVDSSNTVWVADYGNTRVVSFNPFVSGWQWQTYIPPADISQGGFPAVRGVSLDSFGNVWGLDEYDFVFTFKPADVNGTFEYYGTIGTGVGEFFYPYGIAVDAFNDVWVADMYNARAVRLQTRRKFLQ